LFLGFNGAAGKDVRNLRLRRRATFTVGTVGQETGRRRKNNEYVVEQVCAALSFYIISCIADDISLAAAFSASQVRGSEPN
jgi:hypothetical protein